MTFLLRQISSSPPRFDQRRNKIEWDAIGPSNSNCRRNDNFTLYRSATNKSLPKKKKNPSSPWLINSPSNRVRANKQYHRSRFAFASSLTGIFYRGTNDVCLPTIDRAQHRAPRFINNIAPQLARLNNRAL